MIRALVALLNAMAALRRDQPAAAQAAWLFLIPGLAHCRGGHGTAGYDALTPLLRWVEAGEVSVALAGIAAAGDVSVQAFLGSDRFGPSR